MIATSGPRGRLKAGLVTAGTFTGNPKKATITFAAAYPAATYAIGITGVDGRNWVFESVTASGFVINSQANGALTGNVHWQTQYQGETL
jgi:hypothetical protein